MNRTDAVCHAPAAARNTGAILEALGDVLPVAGTALEIGSGPGQHIAALADAFPAIHWIPSDPDPRARASIAERAKASGTRNIAAPLDIDVTVAGWDAAIDEPLDAMVCINVLHVTPWAVCEGLMAGAGALLRPAAPLYLYGPYKRGGAHTAPSNEAFDRSLRQRDPAWGVCDLDDVVTRAEAAGLGLDRIIEMPVNNLSVILRRN